MNKTLALRKYRKTIFIDLNALTFITIVFIFSFLGTLKNNSPLINSIIDIYFSALLLVNAYIKGKLPYSNLKLTLDFEKILLFIIISTYLFISNQKRLNLEISGDQLYHFGYSNYISVNIVENFSFFVNHFSSNKFHELIWALNALTFLMLILLYNLYKKISLIRFTLLIFPILLLLRVINFPMNDDPHPPLRNIVGLLGSVVLGVNNQNYRTINLVAFAIFLTYFAHKIISKSGYVLALLFIVLIVNNEILKYSYTQYESSIWSFLIIFVAFYLLFKSGLTSQNIYYCSLLFSIGSLIRPWLWIFMVLMMIWVIIFKFDNFRISQKNKFIPTIFSFTPFLISLPFNLKSLLSGTPATFVNGEILCLESQANIFERLILAFSSNYWILNIFTHVDFILILISIFYSTLLFFKDKIISSFFITSFIISNLVFILIRPSLWPTPRYLVEYGLPFFFLIIFLLAFNGKTLKTRLVILIIIFSQFYSSSTFFPSVPTLTGNNKICELPFFKVTDEATFPINNTFKAIDDLMVKRESIVVFGNSWGLSLQILQNYSLQQYLQTKKVIRSTFGSGINSEVIQDNNEISAVILLEHFPSNITELNKLLQNYNWSKILIKNSNYTDNVHLYLR